MNKIIVLGRLATDLEMGETSGGIVFSKFRLASKSKVRDKDGNMQTDFFLCVAWREKAELLNKYTKKGSQVMLMGAMVSRQYDDGGTKRTVWELNVEDVEFAAGGENSGSNDNSHHVPKQRVQASMSELIPLSGEDDDLPF